jgi:predicted acetyltransferase
VQTLIRPATVEDHPTIEALFQLYAYDFSEALALDVEANGRFRTPSLAPYATDPRCHAFLVHVDGALGGFALVQQRSRLSGDERVNDVAEMFVLRRFRRHGVGAHVATWLFDRFPGAWEVRERRENAAAIAFWRRVIARYTDGRYTEEAIDDERWRGPVQRFESAR